MILRVLGSSSHGNCYILERGEQALLIECGVSWKQIQQGLDFNLSRVGACLISHEHKDHSKSAREVMQAGINVYCSPGTAGAIGLSSHRLITISPLKQFTVGDFIILPFPVEHDCAEPYGYLIYCRSTGEKLLFATDTYYIRHRFSGLNYIMVECNHCGDVLKEHVAEGTMAVPRKNRLLESHFSLEHCKEFLQANVTTDTRKIVLLHLSDDNSDAERMVREITDLTGIDTEVADPGKVIELEIYPY